MYTTKSLRCVKSSQVNSGSATLAMAAITERLLAAGIAAVVNLAAEEPSPVLPRSMIYCHFPLVDGPQTTRSVLRLAIQTVVSLLKKRVPTLVYCGAGMSRSPPSWSLPCPSFKAAVRGEVEGDRGRAFPRRFAAFVGGSS